LDIEAETGINQRFPAHTHNGRNFNGSRTIISEQEPEAVPTPVRHKTVLTEEQKLQSETQARLAAKIADDFKGKDTIVLDLTEITPLFDFFVITTGSSNRQMHAIAEEIDSALNEAGSERRGIEGYRESQWIVQDYGDIILHVMTQEARTAYDLEGLWADARRVELPTPEGDTPAE
ncbi:UNVERIFIED_CONTAM: hypothetical protein GTU68_057390, partial [Idotea baltica]|nr:hypothetical protein [Idotea baltica]